MTRRIQLPEPARSHRGQSCINAAFLTRLVAELTKLLNDQQQRIEALEADQYIETNLTRPPRAIGARAVVGSDVYIAVGTTVADWVQVN